MQRLGIEEDISDIKRPPRPIYDSDIIVQQNYLDFHEPEFESAGYVPYNLEGLEMPV